MVRHNLKGAIQSVFDAWAKLMDSKRGAHDNGGFSGSSAPPGFLFWCREFSISYLL
jgi:hypothetical protein